MKLLIVMGPPGCGKGTQASLLKKKYKLDHISTGDLFRDEIKKQSELGLKAKKYIDKGEYVPNSLTIDLLKHKISNTKDVNGFILDGFPRTLEQAHFLDHVVDHFNAHPFALYYDVSEKLVVERIHCRAKKNEENNLPVRTDDLDVEIIKKRLAIYHKETEPILTYYKNKKILLTIDASKQIDEIFKSTIDLLSSFK